MAQQNYGTLVGFAIVNSGNTDGFSIVSLYSCGTQSRAYGWFGSVELAENSIDQYGNNADLPVHNWTYTIEQEGN